MQRAILFSAVCFLLAARPAGAFSMLAHEAVVDAAWDGSIAPLLDKRFPGATDEEMREARAYAYGGALIADLGYFPFGSKLFTEMLHYVRSGDFAAALVESADDRDGYAFALGHLAHYVTDSVGHPTATNPAVALLHPDLAAEHGPAVTYADSPLSHVQAEFRFDVLEVKRSGYEPERLHDAIGFEVSKPTLARAFEQTYGLRLEDLFDNVDLAIGTFRWGIRAFMREITNAAWHLYEEDFEKRDPELTRDSFVVDISAKEFESRWGDLYREPGFFARVIGVLASAFRWIPGVGGAERTLFEPLPPEVERLFADGVDGSVAEYRRALARLDGGQLRLVNRNLDTGEESAPGAYALTDETVAEWLDDLAKSDLRSVGPDLRAELAHLYRGRGKVLRTARQR